MYSAQKRTSRRHLSSQRALVNSQSLAEVSEMKTSTGGYLLSMGYMLPNLYFDSYGPREYRHGEVSVPNPFEIHRAQEEDSEITEYLYKSSQTMALLAT